MNQELDADKLCSDDDDNNNKKNRYSSWLLLCLWNNLCSSPKKDLIWETASMLLRFSSRRRFGHPEAFLSFSRTKGLNCLEWFELESKELFNYIKALYINKWIMFDICLTLFICLMYFVSIHLVTSWCDCHMVWPPEEAATLPDYPALWAEAWITRAQRWKWWNGGSDKPLICLSVYLRCIWMYMITNLRALDPASIWGKLFSRFTSCFISFQRIWEPRLK